MQDEAQQNDEQNKARGQENEPPKTVLDVFAEGANHIMDTFIWLSKKLNSSGSVFNLQEAKGAMAEVSLAIPPGGTGEVTLVIGQTRKHYAARALKPEQEFKQGSKVKIADVGVSTMYVDVIS